MAKQEVSFLCETCKLAYNNEELANYCQELDAKKTGLFIHVEQLKNKRHKNLLGALIVQLEEFKQSNNLSFCPISVSTHEKGISLQFDKDNKYNPEDIQSTKEFLLWSSIFHILINEAITYSDLNEGKLDENQQPLQPSYIYLIDCFSIESILLSFRQIFNPEMFLSQVPASLVDIYLNLRQFIDRDLLMINLDEQHKLKIRPLQPLNGISVKLHFSNNQFYLESETGETIKSLVCFTVKEIFKEMLISSNNSLIP